jgi:soluble lytic murein transglycosylase
LKAEFVGLGFFMFVRSFGRIVVSALISSSIIVPMATVIAPTMAVAAPQASSAAVQAAELALKGNFLDAGAVAQRSGDTAAIKLVELLYLRDHWKDAGYTRIMDFLDAAPKWPLTETFLKRAEQTLYADHEPDERVLAHFAKRQPATSEGMLALARANFTSGNQQAARLLVQKVWNNTDIDAAFEKKIIAEFGSLLSNDDHKRRMWRMVYAQSPNGALRNSKRLGGDYQNAAKVAQQLLRGVTGADKQYDRLPSSMREQLGMKYALVHYNRKLERYAKARAILVTVPGNATAMGDASAWWTERRIVARHSIGITHRDSLQTAYQIAKSHGFSEGSEAVEGEFLAGWIALRSLKDPDTALKHFNTLAEIAPSRTEKARAAYWIGRSFAALGDKGNANAAYQDAAQHSTIFYGQLAREQIGLAKVPERVSGGQPSDAAKARVDRDEVVRAFNLVAKARGSASLNMFLWSLANRFNNADDMNAIAAMTKDIGGTTMALRLAKAAGQRNIDIDYWAYPTKALPSWPQMGNPVERSLVFGLSRQESEFDPKAGSKVGAQGLMQIMPGTARLIAKQYKLPYTPAKLMGDPSYNVRLGAAHLGDLVNDFNGSYVLTLVAYNAGPRRAREWVEEYGDPRGGQVDPIDWVESIPFQETRQYVQKVLQNTHVYRARFAPESVRAMSADLKRGTPAELSVAATSSIEEPSCDGASILALIKSCD